MQIFFNYAPGTAPNADKQLSSCEKVEGVPSGHYSAASKLPGKRDGIRAVHHLSRPELDQRDIEKLTTEPEPKLNPANDTEKTEVKNDVVAPSLLDMSTELKGWYSKLPEHWRDQSFRNNALKRFMRHSTNTDDDKCEIDSATCLASADKLLSMSAVPDDDTQTAIDKLVENYLLRDPDIVTKYEYIWAAAKCPQKSWMVDTMLQKINSKLSADCTYTYNYLNGLFVDLVKPLGRMLRTSGITITLDQQRLLDMAYIKAGHNDYDRLTSALHELGGRDGGEMPCRKITLAVERQTKELQTSLKLLQQKFDDLNDRFDKLENRGCSCTFCTIL